MSKVYTKTNTQLTAPGNGDTTNVHSFMPIGGWLEVTLASVDTSATVRVDYSNDGFTTTVSGTPVTMTADGSYALPIISGYEQMRPVFVSEVGGTAVTVDFTVNYETN